VVIDGVIVAGDSDDPFLARTRTPTFAGRGSRIDWLVDLTALFLNYVPAGQSTGSQKEFYHDCPPDDRGVIKTGPTRRNTILQEAEILQLVADYLSGETIAALGRQHLIHKNTVRAHLERQQVKLRPYRKISDDQMPQVIAMYEEGSSIRAIAKVLDVLPDTLRRKMLDSGVVL